MPADLEILTRWIAIIAIASAVQTLLLLAAAVAGWIAWRRVMTSIEEIEARHIAPISAQVAAVVDDVHDVTTRIRRADDVLTHKLGEMGGAARFERDVLAERMWPAVGIARAVSAGLRAFSSPVPAAARPVAAGHVPDSFDRGAARVVERPTP